MIIRWDKEVGTLEINKRADLFVIKTSTKNPYELLLSASEKVIQLVIIDGVARYGKLELLSSSLKKPEQENWADQPWHLISITISRIP